MKNRFIISIVFVTVFLISCGRKPPEMGVSLKLAQQRKEQISNVVYNLSFSIPKAITDSITGEVDIEFLLAQKTDLILDFRVSENTPISVTKDGKEIEYKFINGHIYIPKQFTKNGVNCLSIEFVAGNGSLNRSEQFLYTLLVPDRASTVFPCFDQPDIKAEFNLSLDIPAGWKAVSNGAKVSNSRNSDSMNRIVFGPTKPISTYLFAFAAGEFEEITQTVDGKSFTMYHRENDASKLKRNADIIFKSHAQALVWLEEYTGIPYPFGKLDFVLIPGFQYSGMEHAGAIFYRDDRLLLDENPSLNQQLRQANLIAHEVAHQWFGNLVTMQWFNDVWLKEVFAGFIADMIVNPQYPEVNHELTFLLSHYPRAYSVDRTQGANPIVQQLDNMLFAGTLYGDIIYHKSPIMMKQLVLQVGSEAFRNGVRDYLQKYSMANATWNDLLGILSAHSDTDLKEWAKIWTQSTGRPLISGKLIQNVNSDFEGVELSTTSSIPVPPMWIQISAVEGEKEEMSILLNTLPSIAKFEKPKPKNSTIILNSNGLGYGCFISDSISLNEIVGNINEVENSVTRASVHISLFEMFLENLIDRVIYLDIITKSLSLETEPQIQSYLLSVLETVWWQFTEQGRREKLASKVEGILWKLLRSNLPLDQKQTLLSTLTSIFITSESFSELYTAWDVEKVYNLSLSETDRTKLSFELMVRKPELYETIANGELERITNTDRKLRFEYLLPVASSKLSERIGFVESLKITENRRPEPWTIDGLKLLHHPLRSDFSLQFIEPMLSMLPEIQQTGDIFFPKSWLDAILSGHSSSEAKEIVDYWLKANPNLSENLRAKVLQSADMLYRVE
jgi:aminopeptidase N